MASEVPEWLQVHAFGGWAYAKTDGNLFLVGSEDGESDNFQLGLNVQAKPHEKLVLVVQLDTKHDPVDDDIELEVDYAFVEWIFSDAFKLRAGRVKHPFGIYGETFEIGILRPFFVLPQSIYGGLGIAAEQYIGVGLTGVDFLGDWGFEYDLYAGEIQGEIEAQGFVGTSVVPRPMPGPTTFLPRIEIDYELKRTLGARLQILSPIEGFSFGFSAFGGEREVEVIVRPSGVEYSVIGAHGQYLSSKWMLRGEMVLFDQEDLFEADAYYLEVERRLGRYWRLAMRFDQIDFEPKAIFPIPLPRLFGQVLEHQDIALGISYWPVSGLVLRLDLHHVDGNRFAFPEDAAAIRSFLQGGRLEASTRMVVFGAQFSF